jgi:DNA-binding IclR family transcriptional regulator
LITGGYVLSGRLFAVASHQPLLSRLRATSEPILAEFATDTGHSIHLSVPDGEAALMVLDVPGGGLVRLSLRPGARFGVKDTLSGSLLAAAGAIVTPRGWKPEPRLLKAVRQGRPVAYASRQAAGVMDFGIVLRDGAGRVLGVVTASVVQPAKSRLPECRLLDALQSVSREITARF